MDIKATVEKTVKKLMDNPALLKKFDKEPVKVIEELVGMDLPDDVVEPLIDGIKVKLAATKVGDALKVWASSSVSKKKSAAPKGAAVVLRFTNEFLPALGAGDGDLAFTPGHTNHLTALGAVVVPVLAVFQPVEELEELPVLLIPGIGIPGQTAVDGPDHQTVGHGGQQQIDQGHAEEGGNQAYHQAGAQNCHIQPVGAVASCHEPVELGIQLSHKLSKHRENSLRDNFFSILYCKTAGFQQ